MRDDDGGVVMFLVVMGFIIGFAIGITIGSYGETPNHILVERGHGEYNKKTGEFQLIEVKK